ncbi:hypothetical protein [uncultured Gemmiger sp.]
MEKSTQFSRKVFCEGMRDGFPMRWATLRSHSRWALRPATRG